MLQLTPSTTSRAVQALEAEGFVTKVRSEEDGRAWLLELTPKGARVLALFRAHRLEHASRLLERYTAKEIETFLRVLRAYVNLN